MCLRHTVFASRVTGFTLFGDDLALSGQPALQLRLNLLAASMFEWISATAQAQRKTDRDQDR
jgi:hypothetical protein